MRRSAYVVVDGQQTEDADGRLHLCIGEAVRAIGLVLLGRHLDLGFSFSERFLMNVQSCVGLKSNELGFEKAGSR